MSTTNGSPTQGLPVITAPVVNLTKPPKPTPHRTGGWISDNPRLPGRHRADRPGLVRVSAIAGVDLARSPQRIGGGASAGSLLARLTGGVWA